MVEIAIAYKQGTLEIMKVCLDSLYRHTRSGLFTVTIVMAREETHGEEWDLFSGYGIQPQYIDMPDFKNSGSRPHGFLMDQAIRRDGPDLFLSLDSDCFPVADDWLDLLIDMIEVEGAGVAGVLHPWTPPPFELAEDTIDWRVRSQMCWNRTHVACQLVRRSFVKEHGLSYMDGDDTGFSIPAKAIELEMSVGGYRPTRCAWANEIDLDVDIDPEFNREMCLVYGDRVYHHGSTSKIAIGHNVHSAIAFEESRKKVIRRNGAEFILEDGHEYQFDREEEVASQFMRGMYQRMISHLQRNERLFP